MTLRLSITIEGGQVMTIQIEDLNSLDFSDVADTHLSKLPPIHPGEILREEFLIPMRMTANALALALRVPAPRINDIVRGRRAITPDTALRLSRYFGVTAEFWMNLQTAYDLRMTRLQTQATIERDVLPHEAA